MTSFDNNGNGSATAVAMATADVFATRGDGDGVPVGIGAGMGIMHPVSRKLTVTPVRKSVLIVELLGLTPLLTHRMSKRALDKIEAKQVGEEVKEENRKPILEFREAMYFVNDAHPELITKYGVPRNDDFNEKILDVGGSIKKADGDVHGFPIVAVFRAMERACKYVRGLKMTDAPALFTVHNDGGPASELSTLHYETVMMRRDRVRIPNGPTTLAYRAMYSAADPTKPTPGFDVCVHWRMNLAIEFNSEIVSPDKCYSVVERAGSVGLGAWRPQCRGVFGRFITNANSVQLLEEASGRKGNGTLLDPTKGKEMADEAGEGDPDATAEGTAPEAKTTRGRKAKKKD